MRRPGPTDPGGSCSTVTCREAQRLVFLYADGELEPETRVTVASHLGTCPECGRHARYVARLLDVFRFRAPRRVAPSRLRLRVLAVLPHREARPGGTP